MSGRNKVAFKKLRKIFTFVFIVFILPLMAITGLSMGVVYSCARELPDIDALLKYKPVETSRIYSKEGILIAELYEENRTWVPLKFMPKNLINAIVAIEDDKFFTHPGISFRGIGRALWENVAGKEVSQGGSTITMQLARNLFLSREKTYYRKLIEILISLQIERQLSKDEILELYLNQIPLGSGAYGVEAASQMYFGKPVSKLTLNESALLAGLPQAPSLYSPFVDIKAAKDRRNLVLKRMRELRMISKEEAKKSMASPVKVIDYKPIGFKGFRIPYFSTYCLRELVKKYGSEKIYRGGLNIYSTADFKLQKSAEECVKWGVESGISGGAYCDQSALVCIENKTGFIRAMAGGYKYSQKDQFNRAWQARRQPGSSFKIIVYTAAVDHGFTPYTTCYDSPITYTTPGGESYSPMNSDHRFLGAISLRDAIRLSRNVVAVKTMEQIGIDTVIRYAHAMGIKEELPPVLSLALGCATITPLEMAAAVSVVPNMGMKLEPTTIMKVLDSEGNVIEDNTHRKGKEIFCVDTAFTMIDMLKGVIEGGTGTSAYIGRPAAGKTGTTSDFKDAWFVGFTPVYTTSVWMGRDDNQCMNHVYGGDYPAMTWARFMEKAHTNIPVKDFELPKGQFKEVKVCSVSGLLAGTNCPTVTHLFEPGTQPVTTCTMTHSGTNYNRYESNYGTTNDTGNTPTGNSGSQPSYDNSGKLNDEPVVNGVVLPPD